MSAPRSVAAKHLPLSLTQGTHALAQRRRDKAGIDHPLARCRSTDGACQFLGWRVFEQKARSPCLLRLIGATGAPRSAVVTAFGGDFELASMRDRPG